MKKIKKVRTKIMLCISLIVLAAVLVTGAVSSVVSYQSTVASLNQTLTETAEVAAGQVSAEIRAYVNLVQEFSYNSALLDETASKEARLQQLHALENNNGFAATRLVDSNGVDLETGENISGQDYFEEIKSTLKPTVSEPLLTDYPEMLLYINVPAMRDGKFAGMVMGGLKASALSDIAASIQVGGGDCTILDANGTVIAYEEFSDVEEGYNAQEAAQTDPALKELAALEAKMIRGESGFGSYEYEGSHEMMAYAPIPDSNGWSISVAVKSSEFLGGTVRAAILTAVIGALTIFAAILIAAKLSNSLSRPVVASAERLSLLAKGDLDSPVPQSQAQDETGVLAQAMGQTVGDLREIISDITCQLGAMAQGDFTASSDLEYKGGFLPIKEAIGGISDSLDHTLKQIDVAADQVAAGADQVAAGAQALSQGATEQAASVEELGATINDISTQVTATAEIAKTANQNVDEVSGQITASDEKMTEMVRAMEEISDKSMEIGKIIKTIEDIAFQTNILALNAAVEAARAGEAGKGFAVVADEVRNLANKSQEASQNTAELIENTLSAIKTGTQIAESTARSLRQSVEGSGTVTASIGQITAASEEQAGAILQVNQGVDQISAVVQNNSATAEESAAASEELSGQAAMLKELLARFHLRAEQDHYGAGAGG